jgi:hypothetical protein
MKVDINKKNRISRLICCGLLCVLGVMTIRSPQTVKDIKKIPVKIKVKIVDSHTSLLSQFCKYL